MTILIGAGAGFAGDRIDPAIDLARRGKLDFLAFECLAERTLAYGHLARMADPAKGHDPRIERRLGAVLEPCARNGTTIITNMGVANPRMAGLVTLELAKRLGLRLRIAVLEGDDLTQGVAARHGAGVVGANAYLGAEEMLPALDHEPHVLITGRVADPSLFVAPLAHRLGWKLDDWHHLGAATAIGHLLECTTQVTGGYFADPPYKTVPDIAFLGFPYAEVEDDGTAVITKLDGTGGLVSERTVKEQLLYEVHDPRAYLTPDVTADFSGAVVAQQGPDRVRISGATGRARPEKLKVIVGFDGGFLAEAEFSYAGPGAATRARLAAGIVRERMHSIHRCGDPLRLDLIGINALHATAIERTAETQDVRLRAAMRTADRALAQALLEEVESLWLSGPAGGGGYRGNITPSVTTQAIYVDRAQVRPQVTLLQS